MAIFSRRNTARVASDANANAIWWDFIQDMISQGWRVLGSGDGDSYENEGQTAGSTGTGAGGGFDLFDTRPPTPVSIVSPTTVASLSRENLFANISGFPDSFGASWWRIATPADADHYAEFLFSLNITGGVIDDTMIVAYCRGDQRFNTGASAWQRPSVNTGTAIRLGVNISAEDSSTTTPTTATATSGDGHFHWVIGDADVDYDFFLTCSRDNFNGEVFCNFGRLRLVGGELRSDESDDPDPYVLITAFESGPASTNHNFTNSDLVIVDGAITPGSPERLEDRDVNPGSAFAQMIASYGLDDPAIPADQQGHYAVSFMLPAVEADAYYSWEAMGFNRATKRTKVDTLLKVGRASQDPEVTFHFFKGVLKNDLWGMGSRGTDIPVVEYGPDPADPYRICWGAFHLYWGAEEGVEGL